MSVAAATSTVTAPVQVAADPLLEARGISKRFGPLLAVDHADLALRAGVHALLGENGAGKSTLVKILYGYEHADAGEIRLDGRPVRVRSPADARSLGIGLVFQQFTLIPALTVAENIALFLPDLPPVLDRQKIHRRIGEMSERYGLAVDPARRVGTLSLPEQQRVEILRVLLAGARVLIFDEPTSTLPAQEVDALFDVFRRLRDDGYPILFITHKLPEVFALADTVTVMRRGAVVDTVAIADVDEAQLVQMMFGETPAAVRRGQARVAGPAVLSLAGATCVGEGRPLFDIDLTIGAGEIVGVAGVAGNGQRELADAIVGVSRIKQGRRVLLGVDATRWSVRRIRDAGVAYVPERALSEELIWNMTLEENVALGSPKRYSRRGGFALDRRGLTADFSGRLAALGLELPDAGRRAGTLSGGNAQRFAVARELARDPKLLVALYPTRGLDVPTAAAVQELLLTARERGCGLLLVSQDLAELTTLSDRLLVMRDAHIVAELDPRTADSYEIGALMTGGDS
jgi:general nucleoside transport system ATP-binding protein